MLTRLNLTKCIIIGDARRIGEGKEPVRNIFGLSRELEKIDEDKYDLDKICKRLYSANKCGIKAEEKLVKDIQNILMVEETELVKYTPI